MHLLDHTIPVDGCEWCRDTKPKDRPENQPFPQEDRGYRHLLSYVAENFEALQYGGNMLVLVCNLHGEVRRWTGLLPKPGELELMQAIGAHMDQHDHDDWKKL
jgi:hypothetical protein